MRTTSPRPESSPADGEDFDPVPRGTRHDGWTPSKQTDFIAALGETGCVAEACAAVGMSRQSAYRLRAEPIAQAFRMAWDAALDFAIQRLSDECYARAIHGVAVPHFYQGEQVGEHRRYDNRLAMFLLRYRDPLRYSRTLDHYVFHGHPEQAALRFGKARHRLEAEAWGCPDDASEPHAPFPWTAEPAPVAHAEEAARREAAQAAAREADAAAADRRMEAFWQEQDALSAARSAQAAAANDARGYIPADFGNEAPPPPGLHQVAAANAADAMADDAPAPTADVARSVCAPPPGAGPGGDVVSPLSLSDAPTTPANDGPANDAPATDLPASAPGAADPDPASKGWFPYNPPPEARSFAAAGREIIPEPWHPYRVGVRSPLSPY